MRPRLGPHDHRGAGRHDAFVVERHLEALARRQSIPRGAGPELVLFLARRQDPVVAHERLVELLLGLRRRRAEHLRPAKRLGAARVLLEGEAHALRQVLRARPGRERPRPRLREHEQGRLRQDGRHVERGRRATVPHVDLRPAAAQVTVRVARSVEAPRGHPLQPLREREMATVDVPLQGELPTDPGVRVPPRHIGSREDKASEDFGLADLAVHAVREVARRCGGRGARRGASCRRRGGLGARHGGGDVDGRLRARCDDKGEDRCEGRTEHEEAGG